MFFNLEVSLSISDDKDQLEDESKTPFPIYLDNQATTPTDPRVLDAMLPFLTNNFGNPHSKSHKFGWTAEEACEEARNNIADLIGA